ncbi:MAG TPA: DUF4340 domain-containing protein, partial [Candidatus Saccharimonadia bacterium]|nr:DUF4340 domain-containing protein [Candidatus Saccharimonadia bacterium]
MHNRILRLAVVAVVALLIAIWVGNSRMPKHEVETVADAVPGLAEAVNDISQVRIVGAGNKPIATLEKRADGWVVAEKSYPADVSKVRELLLKLSDAKLVEPKTSVPASYAKLGVEDVTAADAKGVQLEFEGLKQPVKLVVGNYNGRAGDGTFVRRAGEPQAWLAKGNLVVDKEASNWLQRDLLDVSSTRIAKVEVTHAGKVLRAFKTESASPNYQVADVPKGRELSSEFVANGLASVLSGLRFDDVVEADRIEPDDAKVYDVRYTTFEGVAIDAKAWSLDGKDYATFSASLDEAVANAWIDSMQAKAAADHAARAVTPAANTDDGGAAAAISSASATTAAAAPTTPDAAPPADAARAAAPQPAAQSPGNEPPGAPIEAPL